MPQRTIVTAGLPYANGSLHLGHLVEYCQVDMYVRALKRLGHDALYICANDAHGTPIEMNAKRQGVTPEALVEHYHREQLRDFARFDVAFDHFSITHAESNRRIVESVYAALRAAGQLEEREVDGNWCELDQRFLPDRFIRGTCPRCGAPDQYGDVCEACGATYAPTELREPRCALCGMPPVTKPSRHIFFRLSDAQHVAFLTAWIDSGALQPDVANYVRHWITSGLRDWCISRDGPYFGFAIPDRPGQFFYVWLDAPLGYVASSSEWGEQHGVSFDALWRSDDTRIEHVIGKDIVYFHTLFWPALLRAVGYSLPAKVHVHGMLTVNGEKMSKSRGTFINGAVFADHIDPQALRYYYACKSTRQSGDLDLSFDDFVQRINGELVNKHANLFSRVSQFLKNKLAGRLGDLPFAPSAAGQPPSGDPHSLLHKAQQVVAACRRVETLYREREFGHAMRELCGVADIGNEFMQEQQPWEQIKTDAEAARRTCTFAANVCHALAMYLWPIVPRFAEAAARLLASDITRIDASLLFTLRERPTGELARLFERIERGQIDAMIEASRVATPVTGEVTGEISRDDSRKPAAAAINADADINANADADAAPAIAAGKAAVSYDDFCKLDLRIGQVLAAEPIKKSRKLLRLQIDLGESTPRQVVAGLALAYQPETLIGKRLLVVSNLQPTKIMGVESQGMVLAGGDADSLSIVIPDREATPGMQIT